MSNEERRFCFAIAIRFILINVILSHAGNDFGFKDVLAFTIDGRLCDCDSRFRSWSEQKRIRQIAIMSAAALKPEPSNPERDQFMLIG